MSESILKQDNEKLSEAEMNRMFPGQVVWPPKNKWGEK